MINRNWARQYSRAAVRRARKIASHVALGCGLITVVSGQTVATSSAAAIYVNSGRVPAPVRGLLANFGDRLTKAGSERTTLSGTYTTGGPPAALTITWEMPGRLRVDRADQPNLPLIFDDVSGVATAKSISQADADMLESLFDDCPQTFFYLINQGASHRFLGGRFRADDGTVKTYAGPWYDIYDVNSTAQSQIGTPKRTKRYRFDSTTQLLVSVEYLGTPTQRITTEYSQWSKSQGQAFPAKIVRSEGGKVVLTVNITTGAVGLSASDGKFPGH
jgi:hypothetical protein